MKSYPHKAQIKKEQNGTNGTWERKRCGISAIRKATLFPSVPWKLLGCFAYSAATIFPSLSRFSLANTPGEGLKTNTEKLFVNCFTPAIISTRGFSNRLSSAPAERVRAGDTPL